MPLSNDLISQFVKITNDNKKEARETTVYGTVVVRNNKPYVTLDGADYSKVDNDVSNNILIPVSDKSTVEVADGNRVTVLIKNHSAIVTGNLADPSPSTGSVNRTVDGKAQDIESAIIQKLDAKYITAQQVQAGYVSTDTFNAKTATVDGTLQAHTGNIETLNSDSVTIKNTLQAHAGSIDSLNANNVTITNTLQAHAAAIDAMDTAYANIDFSNIGQAAMELFYANSGLIENVVVQDGTITGNLVGVTIVGDMIEGNTIKADKLVIKGEDGLYYKLNTDGMVTEAEQTDDNSLNGTVIQAKSITASKVSVSDLVAFDATIGGFKITDNAIYSEVKDSEDNVTRGIYMDSDGQINFGDSSNYVKYYRDDDGAYKLAISAASILYALNGKQYSLEDLGQIGEYVRIGTYEDEPCIELGENDSEFRLVITNTRILFMEGTSVPAHINNQSLHITKAVIEEEIQQGEFVWKVRQNGNLGLMWKGEA